MEKYSFEKAQKEANIIKKNALELKVEKNENGEPNRDDYEKAEKEKINESVERMECGIDEKMEILLVVHDAKPAGDMEYVISSKEDENNFKKTIKTLGYLGLNVISSESDAHADDALQNEKIINISFSKNDELLVDDIKTLNEEEYDIKNGKAFGFPETAVVAYVNMYGKGELPYEERDFVWRRELPDNIKETDVYPYITFGVLSKKHWQEEIKTAQHWKETIEKVNPKFHEKYLKWAREEWLHDEIKIKS